MQAWPDLLAFSFPCVVWVSEVSRTDCDNVVHRLIRDQRYVCRPVHHNNRMCLSVWYCTCSVTSHTPSRKHYIT